MSGGSATGPPGPEASADAPLPRPIGARPGPPPFVGRHDELAAIRDGLRLARTGLGSAWLISGPPGIGKSSFLREIATIGGAEGFEVRRASVGGSIGGPFGPWEGIFREELPGRLPTGGPASAGEAEPRALSTDLTLLNYVERLETAAAERPQLLLLDDFDRADPDSLAAVELLARKAPSLRVVLVVAIREAEATPGVGDRPAEDDLWHRLRQEGTLRSVPLGPLGEEATRRLVAHALGGPALELRAADRVHRIVRASQGVPFTALELARYAGPDRSVDDPASAPVQMPAVIRERRARLPGELARLLEAAAVMGTEFEVAPLAATAELTPRAARTALRELVAQGWLVAPEEATGERFRFTHEIVWRAVREEVPPKRSRAISSRLAQWWTAHRANDYGTLGRWLGEAGHRREARRALRLAVRRAIQREEFPALPVYLAMFRDLSADGRLEESRDAAELYLSVIAEIRYGRGQRYLPRLLADLLRLETPTWVPIAVKVWEADLLLRQSPGEAAARLAVVEGEVARLGTEIPAEVQVRIELVGALIAQFTDSPNVVLERAEKVLRRMLGKGWAAERCRLRLAIAYSHHVLGDLNAGRKIFEQAKRDARHAGSQAAILDMIIEEVRCWAKENAGDLRGCLHQLETISERYGEAGLMYMRASTLASLAGMQADLGDLEEAWKNASVARRLGERLGYRFVEATAELVLGEVLLDQGWFEEAGRRLELARTAFNEIGAHASAMRWFASGLLVRCYAQQGRLDEARSGLAELEAGAGHPAQYYGPLLELFRAWVLAESGESEAARQAALRARSLSEDAHQPRLRLEIVAYLLRWDIVEGQESLARFRTCELRSLCAQHGVDPMPLLRTVERSARVPPGRAGGEAATAAA